MARLNSLELQPCDRHGQQAWEQAYTAWRQIPDDYRVDLPSPRAAESVARKLARGGWHNALDRRGENGLEPLCKADRHPIHSLVDELDIFL